MLSSVGFNLKEMFKGLPLHIRKNINYSPPSYYCPLLLKRRSKQTEFQYLVTG